MSRFARDIPFGATVLGANVTRFRLWAPAETSVAVQIEGGEAVPMRRENDGWFQAEIECGVGTAYRYRLGSGAIVPDPASRAQLDDVHEPSMVIDPRAYTWRHPEWMGRPWHMTVLYELHSGLMGGFAGVRSALPKLKELGITAVELMPINDFPGARNWGYDGVLPFAPDRAYGTPDSLKELVDEAHAQGLMIFLDVVCNHFGPDGNYLGLYAPQLFRSDVNTPWGVAIDFRVPEVRRFFTENALYWLMEYRFDGLRFDAVHAITEPDWLYEMAQEIRATIEPGRHVHLVLEHDGNDAELLRRDFDAQWNDDAHHVLHVLLTGERDGYYADYVKEPARLLARALSDGFVYQGEISGYRGAKARGVPSGDLAPTAFVQFLQNHDQVGNRALGERLTLLADRRALEAAIALVLLCPQIPLIFMGEEDASPTPFWFFTDHHGALADAVREGRRREFARFAGFAEFEQRERMPDPNSPATFEASHPEPDPRLGGARRDLYRRLLRLRAEWIVPRLPGARALDAKALAEKAVVAHWRMGDGSFLTLATNLGPEPCSLPAAEGELIFVVGGDPAVIRRSRELSGYTTLAFMEAARG